MDQQYPQDLTSPLKWQKVNNFTLWESDWSDGKGPHHALTDGIQVATEEALYNVYIYTYAGRPRVEVQ